MNVSRPTLVARTIAASLLAAAAITSASAAPLVGLTTTNALLSFDSATPMNGSTPNTIFGLQGSNERILGIDLRPTTGVVYGISSDSKIYSLSLSGQATFVGALSTSLVGDSIGIDFNPVADLAGMASLRIISSTGQNFAFNVGTGATTVATSIQSNFADVAYSNNDLDPATATSLYYIDTATDMLKVATANFNAPTITTVGAIGVNVNGVLGFDIAGASTSFAALTNADTGKSGLYSIDLGTGAASFLGAFGIGGNTAISPPLLGLTVAAVTAVPEPGTWALMFGGLAGMAFVARRRKTASAD